MANKKDKKVKDPTDKLQLSKWQVALHWFGLWRMMAKAKKMSKRIKQDPNSYSEEYRYIWLKKKAAKILKWMGVTIDVIGIENWLDRGIVLAPNHQSYLDVLILLAINDFEKQQPVAFIAKHELWEEKPTKYFLSLIDTIPLDRESPRSALNAFKEGKELINEHKRSLVIFPEGTRSKTQEIQEFLGASMKVAQMSYAPVVPVTIIDSWRLFKKGAKAKKQHVKVIFAKPIDSKKHMQIKTEVLTANVQKEVQKNMDKYLEWNHKEHTSKSIDKKNRVVYY